MNIYQLRTRIESDIRLFDVEFERDNFSIAKLISLIRCMQDNICCYLANVIGTIYIEEVQKLCREIYTREAALHGC